MKLTIISKQTANIADSMYLNAAQTVHYLGPLLKSPKMNPCATLITLFMNSVAEVMTPADEKADLKEGMRMLLQYLPQVGMPSIHDAELLRRAACCDLVRDFDKYFDRRVWFSVLHFPSPVKVRVLIHEANPLKFQVHNTTGF